MRRLLLLLLVAGCGGGQTCTLIGCTSQLLVTVPAGTTTAQACVAGVCAGEVVDGVLRVPLGRKAEGSTAAVTVTLAGRTYDGVVPLTRTRPNGPNCAPECVSGAARVDITTGTVVGG